MLHSSVLVRNYCPRRFHNFIIVIRSHKKNKQIFIYPACIERWGELLETYMYKPTYQLILLSSQHLKPSHLIYLPALHITHTHTHTILTPVLSSTRTLRAPIHFFNSKGVFGYRAILIWGESKHGWGFSPRAKWHLDSLNDLFQIIYLYHEGHFSMVRLQLL